MASPQPASSATLTPKKDKKDESLLDKIGTLARKKKIKEGNNGLAFVSPVILLKVSTLPRTGSG